MKEANFFGKRSLPFPASPWSHRMDLSWRTMASKAAQRGADGSDNEYWFSSQQTELRPWVSRMFSWDFCWFWWGAVHCSKQHLSLCFAWKSILEVPSWGLRFEPAATGWEVWLIPLCHAAVFHNLAKMCYFLPTCASLTLKLFWLSATACWYLLYLMKSIWPKASSHICSGSIFRPYLCFFPPTWTETLSSLK